MAGIVGENERMGLGLPLRGNVEFLDDAEGSTENILTLTLSSGTNTGYFWMGRDFFGSSEPAASTVANVNVWDPRGSSNLGGVTWSIDAAGGFQAMSGTTIGFEMNSSGLYVGTTQIMNQQGAFLKHQRNTTQSTANAGTLTVAQSGTLFVVSSAIATSITYDLPTGSDVQGTWYEWWISSAVTSGDVRIAASSAAAGGKIHGYGDGTSVISTFAAITVNTAVAGNLGSWFCRLTAVTSLLWVAEFNGGYSSVSTLGAGEWKVASTAA